MRERFSDEDILLLAFCGKMATCYDLDYSMNYKWGHSVIVLDVCACVSVSAACVCEISVCMCVRNVLWVICTVGWECNNRLLMGLTETIRIKLTSEAEIQPRGPTQHKLHPTDYKQQSKHCMRHAKLATHFTLQTAYFSEKHSAMFVINNPIFLGWTLMKIMYSIAFRHPIRIHLNNK